MIILLLTSFIITLWFTLNAFEVVCGAGCRCLVVNPPNHPFLCLISNVFSITLHISLSHPLVLGVSHSICCQTLDPLGIHLLCYAYGGEKTTSRNVVRNVFVVIVKDVGFHVSRKPTYVFLIVPCIVVFAPSNQDCVISPCCSHVGKCYHCWCHLIFFHNCFFSWGCYDGYNLDEGQLLWQSILTNMFFHFVGEVFGCLHQQVDEFFH